ncbi:MAG: peroxiredoxin, partial [Myxococcota bacterium]
MVKTGEPAPSFNLPSTSGGERALEEFRGKKLVIFFYPKDETPGCTREACGFRDNYSAIRDLG